MARKYIDDLGIDFEDTPQGWLKEDKRQEKWKKQREVYGFDERETWNLNNTFKFWLYERLCMFNEINIINTSYHKFEYKGETLSFQDCIDRMLEGLQLELTFPDYSDEREQYEEKINDVVPIFALCFDKLWW